MGEQRLIRGEAGTIVSYPRVSAGGAVALVQLDTCEVRFSSPATPMTDEDTWANADIDGLNAVITAAAEEGDDELAVSESWVRGRRYLVDVDAAGDERIEVESRSTPKDGVGLTLLLRSPLPRDIELGGSVYGFAVSFNVDTGDTDMAGNGLAIFRGSKDGVFYEWAEPFRIVRRLPLWSLTPSELTEKWPNIVNLVSREDHDYEGTIRAAFDDDIEPLLEAKGIDIEDVISGDTLKSVWALACVRKCALLANGLDPVVRDKIDDRYQQKSNDLFGRKDWYKLPQTEELPPARPDSDEARPTNFARLVR